MDIYDFLGLLIEDDSIIAIYDMTTGDEVFCGEARDALGEFGDLWVESFDLCPAGSDPRGVLLIINIESEEEDGEF